MRIGLPRELLHMEWMPLLIEGLNLMIPDMEWVHVPAGKDPHPLFLDGDACYPFKKMVRTSLALLSHVDLLLLPRIVSLDGYLMCPNFRALPDVFEINRERIEKNKNVPVITPLMEVSNITELETLTGDIAQDISDRSGNQYSGHNDSKWKKDEGIDTDIKSRGDISRAIALIGHPYLLADFRLNNRIPETLRDMGLEILLTQEVPFRELDKLARSRDYYAKKLYWRSARESLGAFLYFTRINRPAGIIHLIPFNCGVDALLRVELTSLYNHMEDAPPYMVLVCDEHTQQDHVMTRIEAFLDLVYGIGIE